MGKRAKGLTIIEKSPAAELQTRRDKRGESWGDTSPRSSSLWYVSPTPYGLPNRRKYQRRNLSRLATDIPP